MHNIVEIKDEKLREVKGGRWITNSVVPGLECWNGVFKSGNCRVKVDYVVNQGVNQITNAIIGGFSRG